MKEITDRLLKSYAKRYGVEFHKLGSLGWTTRLNAGGEEKQVGLNVAGPTVIFAVYPLLKVECQGCKPELAQHLLALNAETHLVKYGIDENWYIQLSVQFPVSDFGYGQFAAALDAIKRSVEESYAGIVERARD